MGDSALLAATPRTARRLAEKEAELKQLRLQVQELEKKVAALEKQARAGSTWAGHDLQGA